MLKKAQWYYTDKLGDKIGPVSIKDFKKVYAEGQIPTAGVAWTEGMESWLPISQIEALHDAAPKKEKKKKASPTPPKTGLNTTVYSDEECRGSDTVQYFGGIGRLVYFLICLFSPLVIYGVYFFGLFAIEDETQFQTASLVLAAAVIIFSFLVITARYKNIGHHPLWSLLILVPIVNIFVGLRCLIYQEGWGHTRKLDALGKFLALMATLAIALIAAIIWLQRDNLPDFSELI